MGIVPIAATASLVSDAAHRVASPSEESHAPTGLVALKSK